MNIRILCGMIVLLLGHAATGCDVCGNAASGAFSSALPNYNLHLIGVRYWERSFSSTHLTLFPDEVPLVTREYYRTTELWGRYYPHPRIQLLASLPYHQFTQHGEDGELRITGIGDASLQAGYLLLRPDEYQAWQQTLLIYGGLKMPTGDNHRRREEQLLIHENMQPGTGSWDISQGFQYLLKRSSLSVLAEASYRINGSNRRYYHFGNLFSASVHLMYRGKLGSDWILIPQLGLAFDHMLPSITDVRTDHPDDLTGGQQWMGSAGLGLFHRSWAISTRWIRPLHTELAGGHVVPDNQLQLNLIWFIPTKNKKEQSL